MKMDTSCAQKVYILHSFSISTPDRQNWWTDTNYSNNTQTI